VPPVRVYSRQQTGRPVRVVWALEEIGVPYDLTTLSVEETKQEEHLARHPLGRVPVLEIGDQSLFESTSLCLHLADEHPESGLIPPIGSPERPLVYQWAIFAMTEVEPPIVEYLVHSQSNADRAAAGVARFGTVAAVLERQLDGRAFLVGDSLTAADIVMGAVLALARLGQLLADYPNISRYLERLTTRPAFQRAAAATNALIAS
jgi:glutathione S-transferase